MSATRKRFSGGSLNRTESPVGFSNSPLAASYSIAEAYAPKGDAANLHTYAGAQKAVEQ